MFTCTCRTNVLPASILKPVIPSGPVSLGKYSSMIIQGDQVVALDQRGELIMFRATPEKFDLMSEHRVSDEETWAHLAASGNELFIRELNAISAFEFESK